MRKLLKKYPTAFSGAATVMMRATTPQMLLWRGMVPAVSYLEVG